MYPELKTTIMGLEFPQCIGIAAGFDKQAEAINELREKISEDQVEEDPFPEWGKPLREALGHKPTEVISGAILGIAVSFLAF